MPSSNLKKYDAARAQLHSLLNGKSYIYGLHFLGNEISASSITTFPHAIINEDTATLNNYQLPQHSIDFNLKEAGYINFFAGSYYNSSNGLNGSDSFFSLHVINRSGSNITTIYEISKVYENTNASTKKLYPHIYLLTNNQYTTGSNGVICAYEALESNNLSLGALEFDLQYLWNEPPQALTLYYFEIPVNKGEYALGSVSGKTMGTYLIYLDISASAVAEGDSLFGTDVGSLETAHTDTTDSYSYSTDTTEQTTASTLPTYYPLAATGPNTGFVVSGANNESSPPGDIRVSRYTKYAQGNWASIRNSLTSTDNAGTLNNAAVYTIVDGQRQTIATYGIGKEHTMNYARTVTQVNDLLAGDSYVYGLHFMGGSAAISTEKTVTIPSAYINGIQYTDYVMPQDCIDFTVATRGFITFYAGTYFSGASVNCFFSLNRIIRDGNNAITGIYAIKKIYGNGTEGNYIYQYSDDSLHYSDGSSAASVSGYTELFDVSVLSAVNNGLTQNSVYYFEIPVDPGEYALGSAAGNGAYLIYLDIAANAARDNAATVTEAWEMLTNDLAYPKGIVFADSAASAAFNTAGAADPEKSVFLSIPAASSSGTTTFAITSAGDMTVTNASATLAGYTAKSVPEVYSAGSLTVNGGTTIDYTGSRTITETVTSNGVNQNGVAKTTVTTTTQEEANGSTTATTVAQTVQTGTGSPVLSDPAPAYDGHSLIPKDYTGDPADPDDAPDASLILSFRLADALDCAVIRNGELNLVECLDGSGDPVTVTLNGAELVVMDVAQTTVSVDDQTTVTPAGTYTVTLSGDSGTYTITVTVRDGEFVFTINNIGNSTLTTTVPSDYSVTVPAP